MTRLIKSADSENTSLALSLFTNSLQIIMTQEKGTQISLECKFRVFYRVLFYFINFIFFVFQEVNYCYPYYKERTL